MTPHTVFTGPSPFGESKPAPANYRTPPKLNRTQALVIRADHAGGMSYRAMSAKHGLARNTLFCVVKYRGAYASLL